MRRLCGEQLWQMTFPQRRQWCWAIQTTQKRVTGVNSCHVATVSPACAYLARDEREGRVAVHAVGRLIVVDPLEAALRAATHAPAAPTRRHERRAAPLVAHRGRRQTREQRGHLFLFQTAAAARAPPPSDCLRPSCRRPFLGRPFFFRLNYRNCFLSGRNVSFPLFCSFLQRSHVNNACVCLMESKLQIYDGIHPRKLRVTRKKREKLRWLHLHLMCPTLEQTLS